MITEQKILKDTKDRMDKAVAHFHEQLTAVRTSRANPTILDNIMVECYGAQMHLKEVASITAPEPRQILVHPWDPSVLDEVFKALSRNEVGLVPKMDGKVIRIMVPELSEERRNDLKKTVKHMAEETRVAMRNIRREINELVKKGEKDGSFTEDDHFRIEKEIQVKTDEYIKKVDEILAHKEKELTAV